MISIPRFLQFVDLSKNTRIPNLTKRKMLFSDEAGLSDKKRILLFFDFPKSQILFLFGYLDPVMLHVLQDITIK